MVIIIIQTANSAVTCCYKKPYKSLFFITLFLLLVITVAFGCLWSKGHYTYKLGQKLGIDIGTAPLNKEVIALSSWKSCIEQLHIKADVAFFGDSLTRWGKFQEHFPNIRIVNLGYSGDTLAGMYDRIDMIQNVRPNKVFVQGGINGFTSRGIEGTLADYRKLLDALKIELPRETQIFVLSMLPLGKEVYKNLHGQDIPETNKRIKALCSELDVSYIDLFTVYADDNGQIPDGVTTDGVHINSYDKWFDAIEPFLIQETK